MSLRGLLRRLELLEPRAMLTAIKFAPQPNLIEFGDNSQIHDVVVGDFDGDGVSDILTAVSDRDQPVELKLLTGDLDSLRMETVATTDYDHLNRLFVGDNDGDGDLDVVTQTYDGNSQLVWFENTGEDGFVPHLIASAESLWIVQIADLEGDGSTDVLASVDEELVVFSVGEDDLFETTSLLASTRDTYNFRLHDIDGDSEQDLLYVSPQGFGVRHNDAGSLGDFQLLIPAEENPGGTLYIDDLDGDGDSDIAIGRQRLVTVEDGALELVEGEFSFWPWSFGDNRLVADYDDDGDTDVWGSFGFLGAQYFENTGGYLGSFVNASGSPGGRPWDSMDVDGDGDLDVLRTTYGQDGAAGISWMSNVPNVTVNLIPGSQQVESGGTVGMQLAITNKSMNDLTATIEWVSFELPILDLACEAFGAATCPEGSDLNAEVGLPGNSSLIFEFSTTFPEGVVGRQELAVETVVQDQGDSITESNSVFVRPADYPFSEPTGLFAIAQTFPEVMSEHYDLLAEDFDRDGDVDILAGNYTLEMLENDGVGRFDLVHVGYSSAHALASGDVDNDGDIDVVSLGYSVSLWRNDDGLPEGSEHLFDVEGYGVELADFDGDGFLDLLLGSHDGVLLAKNAGGRFEEPQLIHESTDPRLAVGDIDNDGDLDAYAVAMSGESSFLLLNDGNGSFIVEQQPSIGGSSVELVDLDGDGRLDIVGEQVRWNDGDAFSDGPVIPNLYSVTVVDFDSDGDLDVVATTPDLTVWLNQGGRVFMEMQIEGLDQAHGYPLAVKDFNGDGDVDIVTSTYEGAEVYHQVETSSDLRVEVAPFAILTDEMGSRLSTEINITRSSSSSSSQNDAVTGIPFAVQIKGLSDFEWSCTATGTSTCVDSGAGPIDHLIQVNQGESLTFSIEGPIQQGATEIAVDAIADQGWYYEDFMPANDRSRVSTADADNFIAGRRGNIRVDEDGDHYLTYTLMVHGADQYQSQALDITTSSTGLVDLAWVCSTPSGDCGTGQGNISHQVKLEANEVATYEVSAKIAPNATSIQFEGGISNTDAFWGESDPFNNTFTSSGIGSDVSVAVTSNQIGIEHVYDILVKNTGSDSLTADLESELKGLLNPTWSCESTGPATCSASGEGNAIDEQVQLGANSQLRYKVRGLGSATVDRSSVSAALTGPGWLSSDVSPTNNSSSATLRVIPLVLTTSVFAHPRDKIEFELQRPTGDIDISQSEVVVTLVGSQSGAHPDATVDLYADAAEISSTSNFIAGESVSFEVRGIRTTAGETIKTYSGSLQIALSESSGSFSSQGTIFDENVQAAGDVDGDGDLDVIAGTLWLNDGSGNFHDTGTMFAPDAISVQLADLNGDGKLDVYADQQQENQLWLSQSDGQYLLSAQTLGSAFTSLSIVEDLDSDGDLDVVTMEADRANEVSLWINDGLGEFSLVSTDLFAGGRQAGFIGVAVDADGDGDSDLVYTQGPTAVSVQLNSDGGFAPSSTTHLPINRIESGDIDGDGDVDLLLQSDSLNLNYIWRNRGDGQFTLNLGVGSGSLGKILDVDGDSDLDAVLIKNGQLGIFLNDGKGNFVDTMASFGTSASPLAVGDFDGDGDLDIISGVELFLNSERDDPAESPTADITGDGLVDFADFLVISANFDAVDASFADGDLNSDGFVDFADFLVLSQQYGRPLQ